MSTPTNHWKLGLFVVVGAMLAFGAVVVLGSLTLNEQSVTYTSYFDEAVTGLDIGSTVKFRGVTIGTVSAIEVAPDRRHVEVSYELRVPVLRRLGLASGKGMATKLRIPEGLRAQLGSAGLSGMKYISIDFFKKARPPPKLDFELPKNYIPGEPSTMKNLEQSVVRAVDQFPLLAEEILRVLAQVNSILADIQNQQVPERAIATLDNVDGTLQTLQAKMQAVDTGALSSSAQKLMTNLDATATQTQAALVSVQRASHSIGDMAGNSRTLGPDLSQTLRDVSEAATSLQELLHTLELDSDMLVKGRWVPK